MLAFDSLSCLQSPRHRGAIGNYRQIVPFFHDLCLAERDHIVRPWVWRAAKGFTVETLMLQKHYGIVAANRRAQQPICIQGVRRETHAQSRIMREQAFAAL